MATATTDKPFRIPATLEPANVIVIADNREQTPWELSPLTVRTGTLQSGDYALEAFPDLLRIERKSPEDFIGCCGSERSRFMREIERLRAFPVRLVIIECGWDFLAAGNWRSKLSPASVTGTAISLIASGVGVCCAGNRERADKFAARLLYMVARREWQKSRALIAAVLGGGVDA